MAKYRITSRYCYCENTIVLMYFVNGVPFTFDELEEDEKFDDFVRFEAEEQKTYTHDDLYKYSSYLIMEECHPCLFEVPLENPEEFPD